MLQFSRNRRPKQRYSLWCWYFYRLKSGLKGLGATTQKRSVYPFRFGMTAFLDILLLVYPSFPSITFLLTQRDTWFFIMASGQSAAFYFHWISKMGHFSAAIYTPTIIALCADMVLAPPPWPLPFAKQSKVRFLINGWLRCMAPTPAPCAPTLRWQSPRLFMEIDCKTYPIRPALFRTTQLFTPNKSRPR